jgi:LSD1 subclass zinc finger protein
MTTRVVVEKHYREYLCRAVPRKRLPPRWRCGRCGRGFLKAVRGTDRVQCAVCHATLVAVLRDERPGSVEIPPAGQMLTNFEAQAVPHGWDVVVHVRALRNQLPDGRTITKEGAAILAWQALSDGFQRGGADLKAMVDQLADVAQEKQP